MALSAMATISEQDKTILKYLAPMDALSDEKLEELASSNWVTIENAKNGDFLFREGDKDKQNIYLLQGKIKYLVGAREQDVLQSGSRNARFALGHNEWPRRISCQAVGDVRFARIYRTSLEELLVRSKKTEHEEKSKENKGVDSVTMVLQSRVMQQIPPSNMALVLRRIEEIRVKSGDVVIKQGDPADYFYIMASGTGAVRRAESGGDRQLAVLSAGESFGEDALVSGRTRAASIVMISDGVLMRLSKEDFNDLIRKPLVQGVRMDKAKQLIKQGATWLDIRHPEEFAISHHDGALNLPLETLRERHNAYPNDKKYVVCGPASDSSVATFLLRERSFDVVMLDGWVVPAPAEELPTDASVAATSGPSPIPAITPAPVIVPIAPPVPDLQLQQMQQFQQIQQLQQMQLLQQNQQRIQDLEQELARYKRAFEQQVQKIRQIQQKLDIANAENERLDKELLRYNTEFPKFQQKLKSTSEENKRLEDALQQARQANADTNETAPLKKQIEALEKEIRKTKKELEEVQDMVSEAAAKESVGAWEIKGTKRILDQTSRDLAEQRELNEALQEENAALKQRLNIE